MPSLDQRLFFTSGILYFALQSVISCAVSSPSCAHVGTPPREAPTELKWIDPMAAQAEPSLKPMAYVCSRQRMWLVLYGCAALLVVVIGVLGLLAGSWLRLMIESWIDIHALFGLLLCGFVLARCQWHVKHSPRMLPTGVGELSRHLSHIVYLLLYVVISVRQGISIVGSLWHGGAVDFSLFDERFRNGTDGVAFDLRDDLHLFLVSALLALVLIRMVTFSLWLRSVERAAVSRSTSGIDGCLRRRRRL
jgi:cytochrome b561